MQILRGTQPIPKLYLGERLLYESAPQIVNPNRFTNTRLLSAYAREGSAPVTYTTHTDAGGIYETYTFSRAGDVYWYVEMSGSLQAGQDYTISLDIQLSQTGDAFWWPDIVREFLIPSSNGDWQRYSYTHRQSVNNSDRTKLFGFDVTAGQKISMRNIKLEQGAVATPWVDQLVLLG